MMMVGQKIQQNILSSMFKNISYDGRGLCSALWLSFTDVIGMVPYKWGLSQELRSKCALKCSSIGAQCSFVN